MMTRKELIKTLEELGMVETSRTSKYLVFTHPSIKEKVYVGKLGAARFGKSVADSTSYTRGLGLAGFTYERLIQRIKNQVVA